MKIRVTQKNINGGLVGSTGYCPVALALKEAGFYGIYVQPKYIRYIDDSGIERMTKTSKRVERFACRYDKKGKQSVGPFNFILRTP